MPIYGRPEIGRDQVRQIRAVATESPMTIHRLDDFNDIFNLYLNAVEIALRDARNPSSEFAGEGHRRDGAKLRAVHGRASRRPPPDEAVRRSALKP